MKNKILIIARSFPPKGGGGVQRIVKFSIYLKELGWDVTVCCPDFDKISWKDETRYEEIKDINVIRVKERKSNNGFIAKVKRKLSFYDSYYYWSKAVANLLLKKENFNFNYVLTSGPPHSIHSISLQLIKKYKFYIISDFRDHFTLGPTYGNITPLHTYLEKRLEQKIYSLSNLIITNTDINKEEVLSQFNIFPKTKIVSIYNGYDPNDLKLKNMKPNFDSDKINLLYLGGLRGDHIDGYFYRMIDIVRNKEPKLLENVAINIVGDLTRRGNLIEELGIIKYFNFFNSVPFNEVGDYIINSDGCLSWQNPNNGYRGTIAGKIYDYFGLEKPIFSLGQPDSELDKIINGNNLGMHANVNNLKESANLFISFIKSLQLYNESYKNMNSELKDSFKRKNQVKQLSNYLLELN